MGRQKNHEIVSRGCTWLLGAMSLFTAWPLSSTRTRITARATGDAERAGVSHADGNGQSRRKVRYLDREKPLSRQTGDSAGDAGATGRSGTSQTAQCKVRDRSHSHRGTNPAFFPIPQPSSERELYLNRSPCVDLPLQRDYVLRVEAPFLQSSIPSRTGTTTAHGFSDLGVTLGWRGYNTPEYAFLIGINATFPTATETKVGVGKYTLGPIIATAWFIPKWESFLIGVLTQQVSVGGDSDRKSINISRASLRINTIWVEKWWSVVEAGWMVNWRRSMRGNMNLELEIGRNVVGKWGVFIRLGTGFFGQDLPGAYSWNIKGGIRHIFPSF